MQELESLRISIEQKISRAKYLFKNKVGVNWQDVADYILKKKKMKGFSTGTISTNLRSSKYKIWSDIYILEKLEIWLEGLIESLEDMPGAWRKNYIVEEDTPVYDSKTTKFFNSTWEVYYFKKGKDSKEGIEKSNLFIGEDLNSVIFRTPKDGKYIGQFNLLDGKKFIHIQLKTDADERFLNILGGVGSTTSADIQSLIVAGYSNITSRLGIVAGFLILRKYEDPKREMAESYFLSKDQKGYQNIPEAIRMFLNPEHSPPHHVFQAFGVDTLDLLKRYLDFNR